MLLHCQHLSSFSTEHVNTEVVISMSSFNPFNLVYTFFFLAIIQLQDEIFTNKSFSENFTISMIQER